MVRASRSKNKKPTRTSSSRPRPNQPDASSKRASNATPRPKKKHRAGGSNAKKTGSRYELELIQELLKKNIPAQRIPLSGAAGGRFGSDVMVFPTPVSSFSVECKYRSTLNGMSKLVRHWEEEHLFLPVRMGPDQSWLMCRLDDFPQALYLDPTDLPAVMQPSPALLNGWMSQAQSTFGVVMVRFPRRLMEIRWLVVIDGSSAELLKQITWPN